MPSERSRQFLNLTTDELKSALIENANRKDEDSRRWFSRFKFASDAVNGNPHLALAQGLDLLNTCRKLDESAYTEIHKGGAFYWLGIASFLVHEYEMAAFFFDSSVSEDLRWGDDPVLNPSPAMRFMRIDGDDPNQAAHSLVEVTKKGFERWIDVYNSRPGNSTKITTQILRKRLFIPSINPEHKNWRSLTSAFISFCLEWDYRNLLFDVRINPGTFEPYYVHLFKGCLLFESLLKENPIKKPPQNLNTLGMVLPYLHKSLGISHDLKYNAKQFSEVLDELDKSDESIERSIQLTGMTRNTLGHNLGWESGLTKNQYQRLFQMVSSSCIHVVSKLYEVEVDEGQ